MTAEVESVCACGLFLPSGLALLFLPWEELLLLPILFLTDLAEQPQARTVSFSRRESTTMLINLLPLMRLWAVTSGASVEEPIQKWAADVVHKVCFQHWLPCCYSWLIKNPLEYEVEMASSPFERLEWTSGLKSLIFRKRWKINWKI